MGGCSSSENAAPQGKFVEGHASLLGRCWETPHADGGELESKWFPYRDDDNGQRSNFAFTVSREVKQPGGGGDTTGGGGSAFLRKHGLLVHHGVDAKVLNSTAVESISSDSILQTSERGIGGSVAVAGTMVSLGAEFSRVKSAGPGKRSTFTVVVVKVFELEIIPSQFKERAYTVHEVDTDIFKKSVREQFGEGIITKVLYGGYLVIDTEQENFAAMRSGIMARAQVGASATGGGMVGGQFAVAKTEGAKSTNFSIRRIGGDAKLMPANFTNATIEKVLTHVDQWIKDLLRNPKNAVPISLYLQTYPGITRHILRPRRDEYAEARRQAEQLLQQQPHVLPPPQPAPFNNFVSPMPPPHTHAATYPGHHHLQQPQPLGLVQSQNSSNFYVPQPSLILSDCSPHSGLSPTPPPPPAYDHTPGPGNVLRPQGCNSDSGIISPLRLSDPDASASGYGAPPPPVHTPSALVSSPTMTVPPESSGSPSSGRPRDVAHSSHILHPIASYYHHYPAPQPQGAGSHTDGAPGGGGGAAAATAGASAYSTASAQPLGFSSTGRSAVYADPQGSATGNVPMEVSPPHAVFGPPLPLGDTPQRHPMGMAVPLGVGVGAAVHPEPVAPLGVAGGTAGSDVSPQGQFSAFLSSGGFPPPLLQLSPTDASSSEPDTTPPQQTAQGHAGDLGSIGGTSITRAVVRRLADNDELWQIEYNEVRALQRELEECRNTTAELQARSEHLNDTMRLLHRAFLPGTDAQQLEPTIEFLELLMSNPQELSESDKDLTTDYLSSAIVLLTHPESKVDVLGLHDVGMTDAEAEVLAGFARGASNVLCHTCTLINVAANELHSRGAGCLLRACMECAQRRLETYGSAGTSQTTLDLHGNFLDPKFGDSDPCYQKAVEMLAHDPSLNSIVKLLLDRRSK